MLAGVLSRLLIALHRLRRRARRRGQAAQPRSKCGASREGNHGEGLTFLIVSMMLSKNDIGRTSWRPAAGRRRAGTGSAAACCPGASALHAAGCSPRALAPPAPPPAQRPEGLGGAAHPRQAGAPHPRRRSASSSGRDSGAVGSSPTRSSPPCSASPCTSRLSRESTGHEAVRT
eukprot:SAG22_NODE_2170_length_2894_cov_4.900894_5_plen_174_part_00